MLTKKNRLSRDATLVWGYRFEILKQTRKGHRYRSYSNEGVTLLRLLQKQLDTEGSIGELSKLGREELLKRVRVSVSQGSLVDNAFNRLLQELLSSLNPFNGVIFEKRLNGAMAVIPFEEALQGILLPLHESDQRLDRLMR